MLADNLDRLAFGPAQKVTLAAVGLVALLALIYRTFFYTRYPKNLPRVGEREGIPWRSMRKRFQTDCLSVFNEAYQHVCCIGNPDRKWYRF